MLLNQAHHFFHNILSKDLILVENQNIIELKSAIPNKNYENENELSNEFENIEIKEVVLNRSTFEDINISNIISGNNNINNSTKINNAYSTRSNFYACNTKIIEPDIFSKNSSNVKICNIFNII